MPATAINDSFALAFGMDSLPLPDVPWLAVGDSELDSFSELDEPTICGIRDWVNHSDPIFRRNRMQVLTSCPLLAVVFSDGSAENVIGYQRIGAAIDRGDQLTDTLAQLVGVSKAAVRRWCCLTANEVGDTWAFDAFSLLSALELADTESLPHTRVEWEAMRMYWEQSGLHDCGYDIPQFPFGERPDCASGEMLFALLCRSGYSAQSLRKLERITAGHPEQIIDIKDYLSYFNGWCKNHHHNSGEGLQRSKGMNSRTQLAGRLLKRYSLGELFRQSMRWHLEIASKAGDEILGAIASTKSTLNSWPPLLQEPLVFGRDQVIALVCLADLVEEGRRLTHCVQSHFYGCVAGHSHIVSIRDMEGNSLSTAEIILTKNPNDSWELHVIQHRAWRNSRPDDNCAAILNQTLAFLREPNQQAWIDNVQQLHQSRRNQIEMDLSSLEPSQVGEVDALMEKVLPNFDSAVAWLRHRRPNAP